MACFLSLLGRFGPDWGRLGPVHAGLLLPLTALPIAVPIVLPIALPGHGAPVVRHGVTPTVLFR